MDRIDWLEGIAILALKAKQDNTDLITKESHATLTIVLSALGVICAYATKQWETDDATTYAALTLATYYMVVAILLVQNCLLQRDYPALYNEPKNLNQPNINFETLRMAEIDNIQKRIEEADTIILERSIWLNGVRKALAVSPIVGVVAYLLFK